MAIRKVTVARALVLLLLGLGIGVGIYVARHLGGDEIERRIRKELKLRLAADFKIDRAEFNLDTGVEIYGLEIYYDDGDNRQTVAVAVKQVSVLVDHQALLGGDLVIRKVELSGVTLRLRPGPDNIPTLPGLIRPQPPRADPEMRFPIVVRSAEATGHPNRLFVEGWPSKAPLDIELDCKRLEFRPQGHRYEVTAEFSGPHLGQLEVAGTYDAVARSLQVQEARVRGFRWSREQVRYLMQRIPEEQDRRPFEIGGVADATLIEPITVRRIEDLWKVRATASLRGLEGRFGALLTEDIATRRRHGLPFMVSNGHAKVEFVDRRLTVSDLTAVFAGSGTRSQGRLRAAYSRHFGRPGGDGWEDLVIEARGITALPRHLEALLPDHVAQKVLPKFSPGGTFDCDLRLTHRPFRPERVIAKIQVHDARFEYENFRYPLEHCRANVAVETNVATPRGNCDIVEFVLEHGVEPPDWRPLQGDPKPYVRVAGRSETYGAAEGEERPEFQEFFIEVKNMPFDEKLERALEGTADGADLYNAFNLAGSAKEIEVHVVVDDFKQRHSDVVYVIRLEGCSAAYEAFPLPIVGVTGTIIKRTTPALSTVDQQPLPLLELVRLRGRSKDRGAIEVHGELRGDDLEVIVEAKEIGLGRELEATIREVGGPEIVRIWELLGPSGTIGAGIQYDSRAKEPLSIGIHATDKTRIAGYGALRHPITGLEGSVLYQGGRLEASRIKGRIGDARFSLDGFHDSRENIFSFYGIFAGPIGERLLDQLGMLAGVRRPKGLELLGPSRFRYKFGTATPESGSGTVVTAEFNELALRGRINGMELRLDGGRIGFDRSAVRFQGLRLTQPPGESWVEVVDGRWPLGPGAGPAPPFLEVRGNAIDPGSHLTVLFGDQLAETLGTDIRIDLDLFRIEYLRDLQAIRMGGMVGLHRTGGLAASGGGLGLVGDLAFRDVVVIPDPPRGGPATATGRVVFRGANVSAGAAPDDMSGILDIDECKLGRDFYLRGRVSGAEGTLLDFSLSDVRVDVEYQLDTLRLDRLKGVFYKGTLEGGVAVHTSDPGAYDVVLKATDVDLSDMLARFASHDDPVRGRLDFSIHAHSLSGHAYDQSGNISVKISQGRLLRVPGLRRLISLLSQVTPFRDRGGYFKNAVANIRLEGETLLVDKIHFSTAVADVLVSGRMSMYGDLDLVVKPAVTKVIDLPRLFNIPVLTTLLNIWHRVVYEIRIEGTISSPALRLNPVPWLKKHRAPFIQSPHAGRVKRRRPRALP